MRVRTADSLNRWMRGIGIVSLAALAWTVLVPAGVVWTVVVAAGLIGSAVVTAVLLQPPAIPSLARAIANAGRSRSRPPTVGGRRR